MDSFTEHSLDDVFPFGKYKGKTIQYVLNIDPSYIVWFYENVNRFRFSEGIYDEACAAKTEANFQRNMGKFVRNTFNYHHYYDDDVFDPF